MAKGPIPVHFKHKKAIRKFAPLQTSNCFFTNHILLFLHPFPDTLLVHESWIQSKTDYN